MLCQQFINFFVLFLPVITDRGSHFFKGDGQADIHKFVPFFPGSQFCRIVPNSGSVIVGLNGNFFPQLQFVFPQISIDIFADRFVDPAAKIMQRFFAGLSDQQMGPVAHGFGSDQSGIVQLGNCLLQRDKIGIFLHQNKIVYLCLCKWECYPIQHIQYNQLIESGRILCHNIPFPISVSLFTEGIMRGDNIMKSGSVMRFGSVFPAMYFVCASYDVYG